jgi:hypothetical protein
MPTTERCVPASNGIASASASRASRQRRQASRARGVDHACRDQRSAVSGTLDRSQQVARARDAGDQLDTAVSEARLTLGVQHAGHRASACSMRATHVRRSFPDRELSFCVGTRYPAPLTADCRAPMSSAPSMAAVSAKD